MLKDYEIHPAHNASVAAHALRHAVRELADDETHPDRVGLGTAANLADVLADALARHWLVLRPMVEAAKSAHGAIDPPASEMTEGQYRGLMANYD